IAAYMLAENVRTIALTQLSAVTKREHRDGDPRSYYGRIRDEFIILEELRLGSGRRKTRHVSFVYEEFMEYVMALTVVRDSDARGLSRQAVAMEAEGLLQRSPGFAQILGVLVYVGLMLRDRGWALWLPLLQRGEKWRRIIFETIRKLPIEQLDSG